MDINREKVHDLIEVFYQPTFKTFYINSNNGSTFTKPLGVFVSLGITTSMKVLEDLTEVINNTDGYKAKIVEISSKKIAGQFLNTIVNDKDPKQYKLTDFDDTIMDEKKSKEELERMKSLMSPEQELDILRIYAPRVNRLQDLINKLNSTNGWGAHLIQDNGNGEYRIFHQFVNYKKTNDLEFRIGIYVKEKNNNDNNY